MSLTFCGLDVVDDKTVLLRFVHDDGQPVVHEFVVSATESDGDPLPSVIGWDREFGSKYRSIPGPYTDDGWPEKLVVAAMKARHSPLPSGEDLDRLWSEALADLDRRWEQRDEASGK